MIKDFDFSQSADKVRACFALPEDDINQHLTFALFQAPEFSRFMAAYLAAPLQPEFLDSISNKDNILPGNGLGNVRATGITLGWIYTDYKDEVIMRDDQLVRDKNTYPLSIDEVHTARNFLAGNIEMHVAVLVVKDAISQYLNAWERYLLTGVDMDIYYPISETFIDLKNASGGFTLPHDLSPHFALSFGETGKTFGEIDHADYRKALVDIFRKQAMKSQDKDGITLCPFSSSFAKTFALKPTIHDDGAISVEEGQFGDLLSFIGEKIKREVDADSLSDYVHYFELYQSP